MLYIILFKTYYLRLNKMSKYATLSNDGLKSAYESLKKSIDLQNNVPIVVIPHKDLKLSKELFLFRRDMKVQRLLTAIRLNISLLPSQGLYLFVRSNSSDKSYSNILNPNAVMSDIYNQYNTCGFLFIQCAIENTFG